MTALLKIYIYIISLKNLLHMCKTELPAPGVTFLQETSPPGMGEHQDDTSPSREGSQGSSKTPPQLPSDLQQNPPSLLFDKAIPSALLFS